MRLIAAFVQLPLPLPPPSGSAEVVGAVGGVGGDEAEGQFEESGKFDSLAAECVEGDVGLDFDGVSEHQQALTHVSNK